MRETYYAHTKENADGSQRPKAEWQLLDDHLRAVAALAAEFAAAFDSADWAHLAGLWHDLGKYREAFQRYLERDPIPGADKQHAIIGALHAAAQLRPGGLPVGERSLAYLIAGHHSGLPDWSATGSASNLRDRLADASEFLSEMKAAQPPRDLLETTMPRYPSAMADGAAFWLRMLFSCLVDADYLDTERALDPDRTHLRGTRADWHELWRLFASSRPDGTATRPIDGLRDEIRCHCEEAAGWDSTVLSLTVPTGGGKTLSSMAYALKHAKRLQKSRIIYVIPYTSIIEQTADVFRRIFGDAVLEHHSQMVDAASINSSNESDRDERGKRMRLAMENWDAPIVITTAVQFFESLFAARPAQCRKLHNIANSVVILDEAQLLPPPFLAPILQALRQLTSHYGVTLLLCTATQPALRTRHEGGETFHGFDTIREIIPDPSDLHRRLQRTNLELLHDLQPVADMSALADILVQHPSVLCIVNTRRACRELHAALLAHDPTAIHLSAYMCGQHRSEVIARIKRDRLAGKPVRVISTSLVEAGVDIDFPVVYRSLAGLDSIAQAAGRCNREGRITGGGLVRVFVEPDARRLLPGSEFSRRKLPDWIDDPFAPAHFEAYFRELYWLRGNGLDEHDILPMLNTPGTYSFRTAADTFRLIPDESLPIVVRFGDGASLLDHLLAEEPSREVFRRLQRYTVTLHRCHHAALVEAGVVVASERWPGFYFQAENADSLYDPQLGLSPEVYIHHIARPPSELMV